ncbi:MAG: metallophosphoesterase [Spirochaetia bacterium]|jgi:predicted MPP superfamily phosphohydrolase|nr:metallophosphoesterase [Spirochaetia bacterium]
MRRPLSVQTATALSLLLLVLFFSCDLSMLQMLDGEKASEEKNTFIIISDAEGNAITNPNASPETFTLLLTSDQHFTRTDSGVYYAQDAFFDWVSTYQSNHPLSDGEHHLTLMLGLGDITDNAKTEEFQTFSDFKDKLAAKGITTYVVKGNHDIRPGSDHLADWNTYVGQYRYQGFAHKGVSFYLLDTAARTLGRIQGQELQEAVTSDARPKLFFSHVPLYGKPSLLYTVLCDAQERENIIHLMVENKGMLFLSGHHHQGDLLHSFRETTSEFIVGSFHGRDSLFEQTKPRWYLLHFSVEAKLITITRYQVETDRSISETVMAVLPVGL